MKIYYFQINEDSKKIQHAALSLSFNRKKIKEGIDISNKFGALFTDLLKAFDCLITLYYNLGHNILRLVDVSPSFPFTTSDTNRDYY